MIGYLTGTLQAVEDDAVLLLTSGGVGYRVRIPLTLRPELPPQGGALTLYVSTLVRENEIALFGFADLTGKGMFELLLKATGIGPKLALNFLSAFSPSELVAAISGEDVALLSTIPGVGRKTATRLCVELAERAAKLPGAGPAGKATLTPQGELISALTNLGFSEKDVVPIARQLAGSTLPFPEQLKSALATLSKRQGSH
ncbi:MAG: Holliday junction branch migration protein RuvA [Deltaproteobacteria bacterium]|nr:Holliday junction branch migration protein RuvA [Deltaproteobacteria bacterium]